MGIRGSALSVFPWWGVVPVCRTEGLRQQPSTPQCTEELRPVRKGTSTMSRMGHSRVLGLSAGFVLLVAVCMVQCEEVSPHADLGGLAKVPRGEKLGEVATVGDSGATGMSQ